MASFATLIPSVRLLRCTHDNPCEFSGPASCSAIAATGSVRSFLLRRSDLGVTTNRLHPCAALAWHEIHLLSQFVLINRPAPCGS